MPDFLDNLNETYNVKLCQPIIPFNNGEKPKKKEDGLNRAVAKPIFLEKAFVNSIKPNSLDLSTAPYQDCNTQR